MSFDFKGYLHMVLFFHTFIRQLVAIIFKCCEISYGEVEDNGLEIILFMPNICKTCFRLWSPSADQTTVIALTM